MQNLRRKNETGRSMVEMLGVLAIMGVLSVGGVYGYGVAMKKHKANELLHQASMLATTISAQIQSKGELPQNIENFGDAKYGTFNPPSEANAEQFTMQITDMDSAVCEQMEKMAGGMVRQAECSETTLTLTYNNNLSSDKVAADYNGKQDECEDSGRKYCSGSSSCVALDKECGCSGTNNGCQKCDTETGSLVADDEKEGENCTTADGKEGTCNAGVCEEEVVDIRAYVCRGDGFPGLFYSNGGDGENDEYIGNCHCKSPDTVVMKGSLQEAVTALCEITGNCQNVEFNNDFAQCLNCPGYFWYIGASVCLPCSYPNDSIFTSRETCSMCGDQRVIVDDGGVIGGNSGQVYPEYGYCDLAS